MNTDKIPNSTFFSKLYAELYLKDSQTCFEFRYERDEMVFYNLAIKRPITAIGNTEIKEGFFDLETAYGYGGYFVNTDDSAFISEAMAEYEKKCLEEKIIAEFCRFHPHLNAELFRNHFDFFSKDRQVVIVDVAIDQQQRWKDYSATTRNILRKNNEKMRVVESKDLENFCKMYNATMLRKQADEMYYFDHSYFVNLLKLPQVKLLAVEDEHQQAIAMGFFIFDDEMAYYHLSASSVTSNANYFMLDAAFDIAHKNGQKTFLLGGGRSNTKDDSLLKFKQKFSKKCGNFFITGKIFNQEKYAEYVRTSKQEIPEAAPYFLRYRLKK